MDDLAYLSAVEALAKFRTRELSPVELLDALVARDEAVGADINAFAWRFSDAARAAAKEAEDCYLGKGPAPRPLEGIPVAVKENQAIAGQPLTNASLLAADTIATATAPLPQRVLDAGGIVHARTTMSEFGTHWATHSRLFGVTRNPWNRDYDVGGSSGGSAAALAAGLTTLATGGDIGGSLRTPAACCGVVGYKPPYGRVPLTPPRNFDTYLTNGPMARTVADCALLTNVIAGPHPDDSVSLRDPVQLPLEYSGDLRGWKIALSLDLGSWELSPDVRANTLAAAEALRAAGANVEEVALAWDPRELAEAVITHFVAQLHQSQAEHPPLAEEEGHRLRAALPDSPSGPGHSSRPEATTWAAMAVWQPMASMVTTHPSKAKLCSKAGIAGISLETGGHRHLAQQQPIGLGPGADQHEGLLALRPSRGSGAASYHRRRPRCPSARLPLPPRSESRLRTGPDRERQRRGRRCRGRESHAARAKNVPSQSRLARPKASTSTQVSAPQMTAHTAIATISKS